MEHNTYNCGECNHQAKTVGTKMPHVTSVTNKDFSKSKKPSTTTHSQQHTHNIPNMPLGLKKLQLTATLTIPFFKYIASHKDHLLSICVYKAPHLTLKLTQMQPSQLFLKKLTESIFYQILQESSLWK